MLFRLNSPLVCALMLLENSKTAEAISLQILQKLTPLILVHEIVSLFTNKKATVV